MPLGIGHPERSFIELANQQLRMTGRKTDSAVNVALVVYV